MSTTTRTSARRTAVRRAVTVVAALAAATSLAACGTGGDGRTTDGRSADGPSPAAEQAPQHNAADVAFAQEMIQHHRQAVEMAGLVPDRAGSEAVRDLAAGIEKAQAPEIETMSGWLRGWGEPVPEASSGTGHGGHGDHGADGAMPGMMTAAQMTELAEAEGAAFDTLFLTMMIEHHEGAVEMAEKVRTDGSHGPTRTLAGAVVDVQTEEIATMRKLLDAEGS